MVPTMDVIFGCARFVRAASSHKNSASFLMISLHEGGVILTYVDTLKGNHFILHTFVISTRNGIEVFSYLALIRISLSIIKPICMFYLCDYANQDYVVMKMDWLSLRWHDVIVDEENQYLSTTVKIFFQNMGIIIHIGGKNIRNQAGQPPFQGLFLITPTSHHTFFPRTSTS